MTLHPQTVPKATEVEAQPTNHRHLDVECCDTAPSRRIIVEEPRSNSPKKIWRILFTFVTVHVDATATRSLSSTISASFCLFTSSTGFFIQPEHSVEFLQRSLLSLNGLCLAEMGHGSVQKFTNNSPRQAFDRFQFLLAQIGIGKLTSALFQFLLSEGIGTLLQLIDGGNSRERFPPSNECVCFLSKQVFGFDHFALSHGGVLSDDRLEIIHTISRNMRNL
jgi:hypothetical protein